MKISQYLKLVLLFLTLTVFLSSCVVTKKKYDEMESRMKRKINKLNEDIDGKTKQIDLLNTQLDKTVEEYNDVKNDLLESNAEKTTAIDSLHSKILSLSSDTSSLNNALREAIAQYKDENEKIKELRNELENKKNELKEQEDRLRELEEMISKNKDEVRRLKKTISDALVAFDNKGLSIHQKDGKVYVSMDEKLLFKSGSAAVGAKGIEALKELAKVLEKNVNVDILIEGHTDNVGAADYNWGLSVDRAVSIVNILQKNSSIDPKRFIPSGRGMYVPIDTSDTDKARQKNRRTEIILMPKLDVLYKMLEEEQP